MFSELKPGRVVKPYLCIDVQDDMKLLVTQWASGDEQWANQFIDGDIDTRIVPQLADTLATLHCQDFDPQFNTNVRPCMLDLLLQMTTTQGSYLPSTSRDWQANLYGNCRQLDKEL